MASTKDIIINVLCVLIASTSIIGNSLVSHVIIRNKSMKTAMNCLILNLALLDVITGLLAMFNVIIGDQERMFGITNVFEQHFNKSTIGAEIFCKFDISYWIGSALTPMFLMVMAYERYKAVVHPLSRRGGGVTKARLKWILSFCWLWGILFLVFDILSATYRDGVCDITVWFDIKVYSLIIACLQFVIPSFVILVLYFQVIRALRTTEILGVQVAVQRARKKAIRKVIFIVITITLIFYVFCGIPHIIYLLLELYNIELWISSGNFSVLLFTINSVSNPFIYFTLMKSFRNELFKPICRCGTETRQEDFIFIDTISLKQHSTNKYKAGDHPDNGLEYQPKLLRISANPS